MKTILCYGDSNTWGADPRTNARYARDVRWTGVLRNALGDGYLIIEAGQNGRTTVWDDPIERHKNGAKHLPVCLETHYPLDLVIIMLGTNDLKKRFSLLPGDIARGAGVLVDIVQKSAFGPDGGPPQVLLIAPPPLAKLSPATYMFEGGVKKSRKMGDWFRQVAEEYGCHFLDAGQVVVSSKVDGVHLDPEEHEKLGKALADLVRDIMG